MDGQGSAIGRFRNLEGPFEHAMHNNPQWKTFAMLKFRNLKLHNCKVPQLEGFAMGRFHNWKVPHVAWVGGRYHKTNPGRSSPPF